MYNVVSFLYKHNIIFEANSDFREKESTNSKSIYYIYIYK
jgi:hypothetical protein